MNILKMQLQLNHIIHLKVFENEFHIFTYFDPLCFCIEWQGNYLSSFTSASKICVRFSMQRV